MIEYEIETVEKKIPKSITCNVCKKKYYYGKDWEEVQEFLFIRERGGYGSIFGDDLSIEGDICQHCLKEKLGEYLIIGRRDEDGEEI